MPSQAEVIQALRNASNGQDMAVPPPTSPADVVAGATPFANALGLPDALKALRGQFTPEEAQGFALTSAMGLLPGAKAETAVAKTMGELLPHMYGTNSIFGKMTPKEYLLSMGGGLPSKLPADLEKILAPEMPTVKNPTPFPGAEKIGGGIPSGHELFASLTQPEKDYILNNHGDVKMSELPNLVDKIGPELDKANKFAKAPLVDDSYINKVLAKNPGASIFDVAGTHIGGPSQPLSNSMKNVGIDQTFPYSSTFGDISREGGIQYTPTKASILGRSENLVHGTRVLNNWETPNLGGKADIGTSNDALRLPEDELGVHFGNPKQANVFSGDWLSHQASPRQYPVVVSTNNPLELPDLGTWHLENITEALNKANKGELYGRAGFARPEGDPFAKIQLSPETKGQFPPHEVNQLNSIVDARDYLSSKGYDSIKYVNKAEDTGNNSYIKFTPSPEAPNFVTGVRSPFAAFDPAKIMRPELAAGIGGGAVVAPQIQEYIKALQGGDQDQK